MVQSFFMVSNRPCGVGFLQSRKNYTLGSTAATTDLKSGNFSLTPVELSKIDPSSRKMIQDGPEPCDGSLQLALELSKCFQHPARRNPVHKFTTHKTCFCKLFRIVCDQGRHV